MKFPLPTSITLFCSSSRATLPTGGVFFFARPSVHGVITIYRHNFASGNITAVARQGPLDSPAPNAATRAGGGDGDPRRYYAAFDTKEEVQGIVVTYNSDDSTLSNTRNMSSCTGLFVEPGSHAQFLLCAHYNQTAKASQLLRFDPTEDSHGLVSIVAEYAAGKDPSTISACDHDSGMFWHLVRVGKNTSSVRIAELTDRLELSKVRKIRIADSLKAELAVRKADGTKSSFGATARLVFCASDQAI